jgi:site-specific DNA recombinase
VLYARVSTDEQAKSGYGLPYQEAQLRQFAEAQGFGVVEVVPEPGVSRTEFNRPGLDRLRELAQSGQIDAVLAWKRDRYFGDPGLRAMFEYEMEQYGVRLLAMDDSGGDRPEDKFSDGIKDLLAQLEVAKTRERTVSGSLQKVRSGKVIIGRRLNYGFAANAARDGYEVDPHAAAVVRRIFSMVAAGASINGTVATLNREAIPSPTGGLWNHKQVRTMILDDVYARHSVVQLRGLGVSEGVLATLDPDASYGVWFYGRHRVKTWRDPNTYAKRTQSVPTPPESWVAVPVPSVGVPLEHVQAARAAIADRVRSSRAGRRVWELDEGVARCGACGWRMMPRTIPNSGRPRYYYVCSSYRKPEPCKGVKYHRAEALEREVAARLDAWFDDPDALTAHIQERLEAERGRLFSGDPDTQARALSERLAKLGRMKANYRRQQAEEMISMAELREVLSDLDAQERAVKSELEKLANRSAHMDALERDAKRVLDFYAATISAGGLADLTPDERKSVYRRLALRVTVEPDGSLIIEGEPDANYLPEPSEAGEATWEEAERVERVARRAAESLHPETNGRPSA